VFDKRFLEGPPRHGHDLQYIPDLDPLAGVFADEVKRAQNMTVPAMVRAG
jgi:hypothetical protein